MLKSQQIQLEQSKRRERMAEIQKAETVSDEGRTELRSLSGAYEGAEIELRSALILEGAERDKMKAPEGDKAGADFERECRAFSLSAVVAALTDGKPIQGREAEVSQELEKRNGAGHKGGVLIPWEAMSLETRADALTTTANPEAGNLASRPVMTALERLFSESAAEKFGFRTVQVTGKPSWPEVLEGAKAHWVGEGSGTDAEPILTRTQTPSIHTATARYLLSRQAVKENNALENVLKRDLQGVMREAVDWAAFNGKGGASFEPAGLLTQLEAAGRVEEFAGTLTFPELLSYAVQTMETAKLADLGKIKVAGAPILLEVLANALVTGTAVSDLDRVQAIIGKPVFSSQVSPTGARDEVGKGASNVFIGAPDGLALIPTWGAPELIVDPYSESRSGKIALTVFTFVDVLIQRLETHFFALSGVQDRA